MLQSDLNTHLTEALYALHKYVAKEDPGLTAAIQEGLLNLLSWVIAKQAWTKPLSLTDSGTMAAKTTTSPPDLTRYSGQFVRLIGRHSNEPLLLLT
mgnify:CR=1 FL=1